MIRFKRILVHTESSTDSDQAMRHATILARDYRARLFVGWSPDAVETDSGNNAEENEGLAAPGSSIFGNALAKALHPDTLGDLEWEGVVYERSKRADAIARKAMEVEADLIVIQSERRPIRDALVGSVAESLCRTAPCPVLVVYGDDARWWDIRTGAASVRRVLVAHDLSNLSELALEQAMSMAEQYQSELHLLHVLPRAASSEAPELAWPRAAGESYGAYHRAERWLRSVLAAHANLWSNIVYSVREGEPHREVLAYAKKRGIDLICMGARDLRRGGRKIFGSDVEGVLRHAPCPVLVARPSHWAVPGISGARA
jgi:nucleotide-binding universal stress UspA family protein